MSPLRASLERASVPVMFAMHRVHRLAWFVVVLALMVGGILIDGWGWVCFAVVAVFLAWLLFLLWPRLSRSERMLRIAILALLVAITVVRAVPQS